jgi:CubicO group peptidase (beta-lactamase class C family)
MHSHDLSERRQFLKQLSFCVAGAGVFSLVPDILVGETESRNVLPRSFPETQGVSSAEILRFVNAAEKSNAGLHSFMVVRHGKVVAEGWWDPYKSDIKHGLYSLSKNFTSTAIGLAVQERLLSINDKVLSFFPEEKPQTVNDGLASMTVRDLLTMSSGHGSDTLFQLFATKSGSWVKTFLAIPLKYTPGSHFVYNSGCTYMLSAILHKITGRPMMDYLQPRLFAPLGIENADWDSDPQGINFGAAGLRVKTEDLAKFGQLYLQKGMWKGKRILSEKWIEEATRFQIRNDETGTPTKKEEDDIKQGYGYQFWLSRPVAQGAYRAEGAFCQYSIIMPAQDAVVAITAEGISTKRVMDLVWNILLPAMKQQVLPADRSARKELRQKLNSLKLLPPKINSDAVTAEKVSGKKYTIADNPRNFRLVSFLFEKNSTVFTITDDKQEYAITCGKSEWRHSKTNIPGSPTNLLPGLPLPQDVWKIAASGTWADERTYVMTWRFYETPHYDIVTCRFDGNSVTIDFANSITRILKAYKDPRPSLKGHSQSVF